MDKLLRAGILLLALVTTPGFAAIPAGLDQACLDWRWIGVLNTANRQCQDLVGDHWRGSRLFGADDVTLPPGLRRFCLFEARTPVAQIGELTPLLGTELSALDRDCVAVSPMSDPGSLVDLQWSALAAQLRAQSGVDALGTTPRLGNAPVRLAVLDNNPTDAVDPELDLGTSPHGNALITMAQELLCPSGGACAVQVTSQLAMSFIAVHRAARQAGDNDTVNGGYLASIGELAVAIQREVLAWQTAARGDRLVMNLSLGWDPVYGGGEASLNAMPAAAQAVHAALADAACRGALVFAAAGNRTGGVDNDVGPLLPGAWEGRDAPTFAQCRTALGNGVALDPNLFSAAPYRPLVFAVSGIEADGQPLDNARAGANARLVAYGDHGVVQSQARAGGLPTATLSGSSVSTLLASVNAAMAWSWLPTRTSHQVADTIYASAYGTSSNLGRAADFCLGGVSAGLCRGIADAQSHRLSLCLTRVAIGGTTLTQNDCAWQPDDPRLGIDYLAFDDSVAQMNLAALTHTEIRPDCDNAIVHSNPLRPAPMFPCPHLTLPSIGSRPYVLPQPGSDLCPQCEDGGTRANKRVAAKLAVPNALRLQISPRLVGEITDFVLINGRDIYVLDPDKALIANDRLLVRGMDGILGDRDHTIIAFVVDKKWVALSTVLFTP